MIELKILKRKNKKLIEINCFTLDTYGFTKFKTIITFEDVLNNSIITVNMRNNEQNQKPKNR